MKSHIRAYRMPVLQMAAGVLPKGKRSRNMMRLGADPFACRDLNGGCKALSCGLVYSCHFTLARIDASRKGAIGIGTKPMLCTTMLLIIIIIIVVMSIVLTFAPMLARWCLTP